MKTTKKLLAGLLVLCMVLSFAVPITARAAQNAHTIVLSSTRNSDGSYSHSALYNGAAVAEYDYTWHADPSTVHTDVSNSPAEYYTGTKPGNEAVYIAHDIYYYPELPSGGFTRQNYDGEQEWCYYYTAAGYTGYIFSTLPGRSSLPTNMMHSAEDAYQNAVLHITQPGDYILQGDWHGQIWVDLANYCDDPFTDPTAKVNLILNGVTINCTVAAGLVFYNVYECDNTWEDQSSWSYKVDTSAAGAVVTLADDTVNSVTGTNIFRILKTQYKSGSTSVQKKRLKIDGAFYSYQSMNIQGGAKGNGVLNITAGYEGMNSELHLSVNGGNVNIFSQDDGINVNEDGVSVLGVNGGNLHILAGLGSEGDGIDSNGYIAVNGGTVITMANPGADSGMDSDGGTYVFGGNVIALGATMDWATNDSSVAYDQAIMNLQFSSSKSAGDAIIITDSNGKGIFAYDPDKDEINGTTVRTYTGAIIASENLTIGSSYKVYIGGEVTGTETMGVYDMTTVTAVSSTYQQSYSSTGSSGGRPTPGGSSSGTGTATFSLTNNVTKFSGVKNYSSATNITVTPMEGGSAGCSHSYTSKVTTAATCTASGVRTYTCSLCADSYTELIPATGHSYRGGSCTLCGAIDPSVPVENTYYLVGFINGANYGCEEDYQNMGQYKFADGKLTATFESDSYVFLKTDGNGKWLLSESYCTDTVCTFVEGGNEKLFVPGNREITFTLTENADGSVTLRYTTDAASTVPTLTLKAPTLEFKDMITVTAFYTAENIDDAVQMGMITYSAKVAAWSVETAEHIIPGYGYDEATGRYFSGSQGIHAKYLGDTVYLAIYAQLKDGTYAYSKLASYSAVTYAANQLKNSTDTALKQLVAAMLNYGAQAQLYFGHNTNHLANASMTAQQKALPAAYSASMVSSVPAASAAKQGSFANNSGFSSRYPAISFEGAFCINYFFTPNDTPENGITPYYWNAEDYNAASTLTTANATGSLKLEGSGTGEYRGDITGIARYRLPCHSGDRRLQALSPEAAVHHVQKGPADGKTDQIRQYRGRNHETESPRRCGHL